MGKRQALEGIRVISFCWAAAGPIITRTLAEHGAEVINIESSGIGDPSRVSPPFKDNIPGINRSGYFAIYNHNVCSVTLNLRHPKGIELAKRLIALADIVGESFRPGTMAKLGLGYDELRKVKPDIIMFSCSNLGQTGPYARQSGMGTQLTGYSGFFELLGYPDQEPQLPQGAYTDEISPYFALTALVAALCYRRRTGKGQYLDISQYEGGVHFLSPLVLDYNVNGRINKRSGNRCSFAAPHGAYPCRGDDRWCVIAVFNDQEWQGFCRVLDNPDWTQDRRFATLPARKQNEEELDRLIGEWTINFTPEEIMLKMQSAGVPAGVVETCPELFEDVQLQHRQHFRELEHPELGKYHPEAPAFKLSKTPAELNRPAPCLGQHNGYVYNKLLGISDEEFVALTEEGVFD